MSAFSGSVEKGLSIHICWGVGAVDRAFLVTSEADATRYVSVTGCTEGCAKAKQGDEAPVQREGAWQIPFARSLRKTDWERNTQQLKCVKRQHHNPSVVVHTIAVQQQTMNQHECTSFEQYILKKIWFLLDWTHCPSMPLDTARTPWQSENHRLFNWSSLIAVCQFPWCSQKEHFPPDANPGDKVMLATQRQRMSCCHSQYHMPTLDRKRGNGPRAGWQPRKA
jgi:hypothetical protein